ncbi:hypothetical protein ABGB12_27895 [Actinocorallia sp. B10E7]|uniref:hypothetical protein n=1 Tax=Actinocorallia sp. B10E7 TaxID=3153558 RepID=UPI00325F4DF1
MLKKLIVPGDLFARAQTISGLRQLADFLEANPAVPVNEYGYDLTFYTTRCIDTAQREQVHAVAALLGVTPYDDTDHGGHLNAWRSFGRVTYSICHIPQRSREDFRARSSYENNIVLDTDRAA